jgi:hypothetical protein
MFAREGADVAIVYLPAEQRDADETRTNIEREGRGRFSFPGSGQGGRVEIRRGRQ